jgi:hypothetical protein
MITKETTHHSAHTEHSGNGKDCKKGMLIGNLSLSCLACIFAILASVFSILAFIDAHKSYNLEIIRGGGQANFDAINEFYQTPAFVEYVTTSQAQSIASFQGDQGEAVPTNEGQGADTPTANPSSTLEQ